MNSSRLPADQNEIQLLNDGSWSAHDSSADANSLDTPRKSTQKVEVISDDIGKAKRSFIFVFRFIVWNDEYVCFGLIEVIIEDDSPKSSMKAQSMNGANDSTTASKSNEPTSTTTGDSVIINIHLFLQKNKGWGFLSRFMTFDGGHVLLICSILFLGGSRWI